MYSLIKSIKVKIGNLTFYKVLNCKIEKTTRLLSNKATIELPLTAVYENTKVLSVAQHIKRGDKVEIWLGYNEKMKLEFTGFVESIGDKEKTVINCEDSMFMLRKPLKNKIFKKTTLKEIVNYIVTESGLQVNSDIPEINFESFVLKNITSLVALQRIKDDYGFMVYLDNDNKVYVGLSYVYNTGKVKYNVQKNVQDNDLTYKQEDELKFKVKAISLLKNNKRLEIETGDEDGELRTLHFNNITDEAELKKLALQEIEKYKYSGYRGTLTSWGWPYVTFGMTATIQDDNYPARAGNYYVEGVTAEWGQNGFERKVEIGIKL